MAKSKKSRLESLQESKLEKELEVLNRPWYKNVEYYKILVPITIGLLSFIVAFQTGLIDREKKDLEITKKRLSYDIVKFNDKKDSLNTLYQDLKNSYCGIKGNVIYDRIQIANNWMMSIDDDVRKELFLEYIKTKEFQNEKNSLIKDKEFFDLSKGVNKRFFYKFSETKFFKKNIKRFKQRLLEIRDSTYEKLVSSKIDLNGCEDVLKIVSSIPTNEIEYYPIPWVDYEKTYDVEKENAYFAHFRDSIFLHLVMNDSLLINHNRPSLYDEY